MCRVLLPPRPSRTLKMTFASSRTGEPDAPAGIESVTHAVLTAGGIDTTYARCGSGEPLLLLSERGDPASDDLARALAARFRVIIPTVDVSRDRWTPRQCAAWLRDLLDGLGIESAFIVAAEGMASSALSFAGSDPLRVRRLAVVDGEFVAEGLGGVPVGVFGSVAGMQEFLVDGN